MRVSDFAWVLKGKAGACLGCWWFRADYSGRASGLDEPFGGKTAGVQETLEKEGK
jgi:hypothetical protein